MWVTLALTKYWRNSLTNAVTSMAAANVTSHTNATSVAYSNVSFSFDFATIELVDDVIDAVSALRMKSYVGSKIL